MPCVESLKKFLSPDHLFPKTDDPEYLIHAAQPYGDPSGPYAYRIKLLLDQVENTFGSVPRELDKLVAASQAVQAEAVKFFIENFRFPQMEQDRHSLVERHRLLAADFGCGGRLLL